MMPRWAKHAWGSWQNLGSECRASIRESRGIQSSLQLCRDFALYRLVPYMPGLMRNGTREVRLRNGAKVRYRLNRGDIQSIREIWLEKAYRLPYPVSNRVLVDLGANIGLTSIWLTKEYGFARVIAVEPDPANAALIRTNFELNGISGSVVEAAIGPCDGTAKFQPLADSNLGRLADEGRETVAMVSMESIFNRFQLPEIDLLKMDIEGAEQALLAGSPEWLRRTKAIIVEFHPAVVDYPFLTQLLERRGFRYVRANTAFPNNMDSFYRVDSASS